MRQNPAKMPGKILKLIIQHKPPINLVETIEYRGIRLKIINIAQNFL